MKPPAKTDAAAPCQCGGTMKIKMIEPLPAEPTMMQHTFVCASCGETAKFKFLKEGLRPRDGDARQR